MRRTCTGSGTTKVSTNDALLRLLLLLLDEIGFPASDYVGKRVFSSDEQLLPFDLRSSPVDSLYRLLVFPVSRPDLPAFPGKPSLA